MATSARPGPFASSTAIEPGGGLERVHDLLMGVRAPLRAVCVVANPRNSQAIAVVCASQPIPNRIPHTFIRDHEYVLKTPRYVALCPPPASKGYSDSNNKTAIAPLNICSARGDCSQRPITLPNSVHTLMQG